MDGDAEFVQTKNISLNGKTKLNSIVDLKQLYIEDGSVS